MQKVLIQVTVLTLSDTMRYEGTALLTYTIKYPCFTADYPTFSLAHINHYYEQEALGYEKYLRKKIYPQAVESYQYAERNDFPKIPYEAVQNFKVTFLDSRYLSLYTDRYLYTGGAHGNTIRTSDTWNLKTGEPVSLSDFFPEDMDYVSYILQDIYRQAEKGAAEGIYFENYRQEAEETFDEQSFYLTPQGIVVYFQQYDIAPYSTGIPEFLTSTGA